MLDTEKSPMKQRDHVLFPDGTFSYLAKRKNKWFNLAVLLTIISVLGAGIFFQQKLCRLQRKQKVMRQSMKMLGYGVGLSKSLGNVVIPAKLANVPFGEDSGLVVGVKSIDIQNVTAPYNPSIIRSASGYDLFFRYDVISSKSKYIPFSSRIGVVQLNESFEQGNEEFKRIDLQTEYAEDPRVLFVGDQLYLFCNQLDQKNYRCRFMCAVNLDPKSYKMNYSTALDLNLQWIEKNWNPFEYIGEDQKAHLLLEYRLSPRKLFELPNPQVNQMQNLILPTEAAYTAFSWTGRWGEMRPGTPAQKIGDEYLGFFHSFFVDDNTKLAWYVMGAYTFEAAPPFRITRISPYPILFKGIYETPILNTASIQKRVIFPSGFIVDNQGDRDLIHVVCGENDSSVKVVTIDREKLITSMERFENEVVEPE